MRQTAPRLLIPILVPMVAVVAVLPPATASNAGRPTAIAWQPCPEIPAVDCGTVSVPLDWTRPHGQRIELAVARQKVTDPAVRIGSLLFNFGGPGASGVAPVIEGTTPFPDQITRRFDLVGWDQRGVGQSHPFRCSADVIIRMLQLVNDRLPANRSEFDQIATVNRRLFDDCRKQTGPVFDHADARSNARDLDAIRAALGESTLTFYGRSYGTVIGLQYAEQYPHRVRALALDGVVDHSLDTNHYWDTTAAAVQDSFDEFVAWSDRTPESALRGRDVRVVWHDLLARAAAGLLPSPVEPQRPARPEELIGLAYRSFNGPDWTQLAQTLATLRVADPPTSTTASTARPTTDLIEFPALIWCSDWSLPVRSYDELASRLRRSARIAPDMRYFPEAPIASSLACLSAPTPVPNPQHRLKVGHLTTPLLLINALHDPTSGYRWASTVARQVGRDAVLLTYDGWGHGLYREQPRRGSQCVDTAIDRYLLTQTSPPPGTHCPAVEPSRTQEP